MKFKYAIGTVLWLREGGVSYRWAACRRNGVEWIKFVVVGHEKRSYLMKRDGWENVTKHGALIVEDRTGDVYRVRQFYNEAQRVDRQWYDENARKVVAAVEALTRGARPDISKLHRVAEAIGYVPEPDKS